MDQTVVVTGGNGSIGTSLVPGLQDRGYRVVNVSRSKSDAAGADAYVRADVTDAGDVYGALAKESPDAVVHLAAIPTPDSNPDHETFLSNAGGTWHVLEACEALGVDRAVLASSLASLGAGFEPTRVTPEYLPLDAAHPQTPSDAYGLGKQALELVADGFARRDGAPTTLTSLRFPWVPDEDAMRRTFVEPDRTLDAIRAAGDFHTARNTFFTYLARPDAVRLVAAALDATHDGHEAFFVSAPDTTTETPTPAVLDDCYPEVETRREFGGHDALVSNERARELLGWAPELSWRDL